MEVTQLVGLSLGSVQEEGCDTNVIVTGPIPWHCQQWHAGVEAFCSLTCLSSLEEPTMVQAPPSTFKVSRSHIVCLDPISARHLLIDSALLWPVLKRVPDELDLA